MPRTDIPKNLPDLHLVERIQQEIRDSGWQTLRDHICTIYEQRLEEIKQQNTGKKPTRLKNEELVGLAVIFLERLKQLHIEGTDTEQTIEELAATEMALLEKGYPKETISKNHLPLYGNLIRWAISQGQLPLTAQNSWSYPIFKRDTGELIEITEHYALTYLKYDSELYWQMKFSTNKANNKKQDNPKPIQLKQFLAKTSSLLQSDSYTELAVGIAAATGRRYSEVIARGNATIPENADSPYEFIFDGQLKKSTGSVAAYSTYSLVPATAVVEAIARFRSHPKIAALAAATIKKLNSLNPAINYQVKRHFESTGILQVLEGETGVTIQNLRGAYGEIATHFFCTKRSSFPRFLSTKLGHLIGDETVDHKNSPSTEHYFHYYLVDTEGRQIDAVGVKFNQVATDTHFNEVVSSSLPMNQVEVEVEEDGHHTQEPLSITATDPLITVERERYVQMCQALLKSNGYSNVLAALVCLTGRTPTQLFKTGTFRPFAEYELEFTSQQLGSKQQIIHTFIRADDVLDALYNLMRHPKVISYRLAYAPPNTITTTTKMPLQSSLTRHFAHIIPHTGDSVTLDDALAAYQQLTAVEPTQPASDAVPTGNSISAIEPVGEHVVLAPSSSQVSENDQLQLQQIHSLLLEAAPIFGTSDPVETLHTCLDLAKGALLQQPVDSKQSLQPVEDAPNGHFTMTAMNQMMAQMASLVEAIATLTRQLADSQARLLQLQSSTSTIIHPQATATSTKPSTPGRRRSSSTTTATNTVAIEPDSELSHPQAAIDFTTVPTDKNSLSPQEKLLRAVFGHKGIMAYNNTQGRPLEDKWAINQNSVYQLSGCYMPLVREFMQQYQSVIDAHNQSHQLGTRHNYSKGRAGVKIDEIITDWWTAPVDLNLTKA